MQLADIVVWVLEGERRIEGKHLSIVTRWEGVLSAVAVLYLGAAELLAALL